MNPQIQAAAGALLGQGLGNNAALVATNAASQGGFPAGSTSDTSAFDRPRPVIVMGPSPLPVTVVGGLPAGAKAGPAPAARPQSSGPGGLEQIGTLLARHFRALFDPLTRLTTYLGATTSGFSVFQGAIKVFANSVGAVLFPVILLLTVGLIEASDAIWGKLQPVIKSWIQFMLESGLPAIKAFVDALSFGATHIGRAVKGGKNLGETLGNAVYNSTHGTKFGHPDEPGSGVRLNAYQQMLNDIIRAPGVGVKQHSFFEQAMINLAKQAEDRLYGRKAGDGAGGPGGGKALADVIREFQMQAGPRASFQGLGNVRAAGLQAALNFSPFEQRILTMVQGLLAATQEAAANTRKGPDPTAGWKK